MWFMHCLLFTDGDTGLHLNTCYSYNSIQCLCSRYFCISLKTRGELRKFVFCTRKSVVE